MLAGSASVRVARADPLDGIELRWSGPSSCADQGEVESEARRLLPVDGHYEPTQIDMAVQELAAPRSGYQLRLTARSESRAAERTLELATCAEVREAAGLLVALTLDPEAVAAAETAPPAQPQAPPAPEPAPASPPQPATEPPPAAQSPPHTGSPPPPEPIEPSWSLGPELNAAVLLDSSALPAVALGPFASAALRAGALRLSLGGLYLPGAERAAAGDGSIRATLLAAQLGACAMWRAGSAFEAGPCASAELGRYAARARGVTHGEGDAALWSAATLGGSAALELSRQLAITATVSLLIPFRRPVLGLQAMEAAYRVPPLSLRAALGVRWF